jgi:hypothetical protein
MPYADPARRRAHDALYNRRPDVAESRRNSFARYAKANREKLLANGAEWRLRRRAMALIATARTRAKKRGLEFDLSAHADELQARIDCGLCELTGMPFDLSPGRKFNSPSFDRINPKKGYIFSNVRVVLNLVNVALGDWGEETLRKVMVAWLSQPAMPSSRKSRRASSKPT